MCAAGGRVHTHADNPKPAGSRDRRYGIRTACGALTAMGCRAVDSRLTGIAYRFPGFACLAKARPKLLIADGELNTHVMRREFMSRDEIYSHLRLHGIEDMNRVRRAYLEPNGMISVLVDSPTRGDDDTGH